MSITLREAEPAIVVDEARIDELANWRPDLSDVGSSDSFVLIEPDENGKGGAILTIEADWDGDATLFDMEDPALIGRLAPVEDVQAASGSGFRRPANFGDGARKLHAGEEVWWWEPPTHVLGDSDALDDLGDHIVRLLTEGYIELRATLLVDGREFDVRSFNAVDSTDIAYLADLGNDLVVDMIDWGLGGI